MITLSGYNIKEKLHEGAMTVVYRGESRAEQKPVILKFLRTEFPKQNEIAQFLHELEICENPPSDGVIRAHALEQNENSPVLILEDFDGITLEQWLEGQVLQLDTFLDVAIQLARTLFAIHQKNIVHKDIKPQNILIHPGTKQVKITDFGIASFLTREKNYVRNPERLEGTLAYMSPEQTGRMNRAVDFRSDFYSLGVTFYEMLTGRLPFTSKDPLELVYCHIAQVPEAVDELRNEIPRAISAIINKLLAKTAEERYKSAHGLLRDLEKCRKQLEEKGEIADFPSGMDDISSRLQIPEKLYGRENEIHSLQKSYQNATEGEVTFMLVSGYSGIGKSALIHELQKYIVEHRGYFISGKFDQFKRDIPHKAVIEALIELIRQILTENQSVIDTWKENLERAFGPNGQVIIDVIPELELIVGTQPSVPKLTPLEAQNRFNSVFLEFLRTISSVEHPLVLFLDDLQWVDGPSLRFIEMLVSDAQIGQLFIIGAYRDNEVKETHPLMESISRIKKSGFEIPNIHLNPLSIENVRHLLSDTLDSDPDSVEPLARLCVEKTEGNPFFLGEFLSGLYQDELLEYEAGQGWKWDVEKIKGANITENVVDFMANKIRSLPENKQNLLKTAAAIGSNFNLDMLSKVHGSDAVDAGAELWEVLEAGLILPLNNSYRLIQDFQKNSDYKPDLSTIRYRFLHDRVQQAAYSLLSDDEKIDIHRSIGHHIMDGEAAGSEVSIIEIADHLNKGVHLNIARDEKIELAKLNLQAAKKARTSTAYDSAAKYIKTGLDMMGQEAWEDDYELMLSISLEAVEIFYLATEYEEADKIFEIVLSHSKDPLETVGVYIIRIQLETSRNNVREAVDIARDILKKLGINLPANPGDFDVIKGLIGLKLALRGKSMEELLEQPPTENRRIQAAMVCMAVVNGAAYQAAPNLMVIMVFTMLRLSLKYGYSKATADAYATYSLVLAGSLGDLKSGREFGELAMKLLSSLDAREYQGKVVYMWSFFIRHWQEHVRDAVEELRTSEQYCYDNGDLTIAGYSVNGVYMYSTLYGESLSVMDQEYEKQKIHLVQELKQEQSVPMLDLWGQYVSNLIHPLKEPCRLKGERCDEDESLPVFQEIGNRTAVAYLHFIKLALGCFFKEFDVVVQAKKDLEPYLDAIPGMVLIPQYHFYAALSLLALYHEVDRKTQKAYMKSVKSSLKLLHQWADSAPMNQLHRVHLVEGEKARVENDYSRAVEHFEKSIEAAHENKYIQDEALAYEVAAEFYHSKNNNRIARMYFNNAFYTYNQWGAVAKADQLKVRHPEFFISPKDETAATNMSSTYVDSGASLDLESFLKASQAISGEIKTERLLNLLMNNLVENAGARRGLLILVQDGKFMIQAEKAASDAAARAMLSLPVEGSNVLSEEVINFVQRTHESVVLNDAVLDSQFGQSPYIQKHQPKSVLCTPIIHQDQLIGLTYLENDLTPNAFTPDRLRVLELLSAQAAISLENAGFYQKLEKSEQKYRSLYERAVEGIFQSTPDGRVLSANPALARIMGYDSSEELLASMSNLSEQFYNNVEDREEFRRTLDENGRIQGYEAQAKRKDGSIFWGSLSAHSVKDMNGTVLHYEGSLIDVTERKDKEKALSESEAANAANAAKSEFLANMSHEIRTPMNGVVGMTELLMTTELTVQQQDYAEAISGSADALLVVLNDILDFSKIQAGKLALESVHFDFRKTVEQIGQLFSGQTRGKGIDVLVRYPPDIPTRLLGDPTRIRQILSNLTGNAVKFTEHGHILMRVICENQTEEECTLLINVTDTGIGIPADRLGSIFDQFSQADESTTRRFGGTGLGLAISSQLVNLMGGEIGVDSVVGEGSTFWFRATFSYEKEEVAERIMEVDLSNVRVLVVDDNQHNRTIALEYLKSWNIPGVAVSSAKEGLEELYLAKRSGNPYGIAVVDYFMPEMNGSDLARSIKADENLKETEVILLSSGVLLGDLDEPTRKYFSADLTKPIRISLFLKTLMEVWDRRGSDGAAKTKKREPAAEKPVQLNADILLVEDSKMNQRVAKGILRRYGCNVDVVDNGQQALEQLQEKKYQLIFMDGHMPVMDGFEATKNIRLLETDVKHIPIIAMTALAMEGDREKCLEAGMDDYVAKPVKSSAVLEVLLKFLQAPPEKSK